MIFSLMFSIRRSSGKRMFEVTMDRLNDSAGSVAPAVEVLSTEAASERTASMSPSGLDITCRSIHPDVSIQRVNAEDMPLIVCSTFSPLACGRFQIMACALQFQPGADTVEDHVGIDLRHDISGRILRTLFDIHSHRLAAQAIHRIDLLFRRGGLGLKDHWHGEPRREGRQKGWFQREAAVAW